MLNGMVPGMNLLAAAQTVIAKQEFTYFEYDSRVKNSIGNWISTFKTGVLVLDTIQPIPKALLREMGLPLEKSHIMVYTSVDMRTPVRGGSSDIIEFAGRRFQALEPNDWISIDGWKGLVFVDIGSISEEFPGVLLPEA